MRQDPDKLFPDHYTKLPNQVAQAPFLDAITFRVYACLLSLNPCHPSYDYIQKATGLSRKSVSKALKKLKRYRMIVVLEKGSFRGKSNLYKKNPVDDWKIPSPPGKPVAHKPQDRESPSEPSTSLSETLGLDSPEPYNKTNEEEQENKTNVSTFDFEALYSNYPKRPDNRMKKSLGMKAAKKQIRSQEDYNNLSLAVENYAYHVSHKMLPEDKKFILSWGSFFVDQAWHDWIDQKPPEEITISYDYEDEEPYDPNGAFGIL